MSKQPRYKPLNHMTSIITRPQTEKSRQNLGRIFPEHKDWYELRDEKNKK